MVVFSAYFLSIKKKTRNSMQHKDLLSEKNRFKKQQSADLRFIPSPDKNRKIRYSLEDNASNRTEYGREIAKAFWGDDINSQSRILLSQSIEKPVQRHADKTTLLSTQTLKYSINFADDFYFNPMSYSDNGCVYFGAGDALFSYKSSSKRMEVIYKANDSNVGVNAVSTSSDTVFYSLHKNKGYKY
jgi:hypothetical protein